jgi:hypothetical protein
MHTDDQTSMTSYATALSTTSAMVSPFVQSLIQQPASNSDETASNYYNALFSDEINSGEYTYRVEDFSAERITAILGAYAKDGRRQLLLPVLSGTLEKNSVLCLNQQNMPIFVADFLSIMQDNWPDEYNQLSVNYQNFNLSSYHLNNSYAYPSENESKMSVGNKSKDNVSNKTILQRKLAILLLISFFTLFFTLSSLILFVWLRQAISSSSSTVFETKLLGSTDVHTAERFNFYFD